MPCIAVASWISANAGAITAITTAAAILSFVGDSKADHELVFNEEASQAALNQSINQAAFFIGAAEATLAFGYTVSSAFPTPPKSPSSLPLDQVKYSQAEVSAEFGSGPWEGKTVESVADDISSGNIDFHPVTVFQKEAYMDDWPMKTYTTRAGNVYTGSWSNLENGAVYSINNRGLTLANLAGVDPVPVRWASNAEIVNFSYQYNTPNYGTSIMIRYPEFK